MSPGRDISSPPPERGRSAIPGARSSAPDRRVGVPSTSHFDKTRLKTSHARNLRRASTDVEALLWQKLRANQLGVSFRRQHPSGRYVLDFYCPALRLAIELDGGQHATAEGIAHDAKRQMWLTKNGVTVLRFWNSDVTANLSGVLETIAARATEAVIALRVKRRCMDSSPVGSGETVKRSLS